MKKYYNFENWLGLHPPFPLDYARGKLNGEISSRLHIINIVWESELFLEGVLKL